MNNNLQREIAVFDLYAGLRRIGYTSIGAMRTLRTVGVPLAEAKLAADTYDYAADKSPKGTAQPWA